jgi:hypothetical protein
MEETNLLGQLQFDNPVNIERSGSRKFVKKEYVMEILTCFFILLFSYAGLRKLVDLNMFVREVWGFSLFGSKTAVRWEFISLSCVELLVALLLSIPKTRTFGWYSTFILIVALNVAMFYMQQFAKVIPIYYGGIIPGVSFIIHFSFNILTLFLALIGLLRYLEASKVK